MNADERDSDPTIPIDPVRTRRDAVDLLFETTYQELRRMADREMGRERQDHTLQPTALLNEVYLRLAARAELDPNDRMRFLGIATRAMRQVLVDHARAHNAVRRGHGWTRVDLTDDAIGGDDVAVPTIDLARALERLRRSNERVARVVELRIFGGLTGDEIASICGVSRKTVSGDWQFARRWLRAELLDRSAEETRRQDDRGTAG